jgi:hypothetical protein
MRVIRELAWNQASGGGKMDTLVVVAQAQALLRTKSSQTVLQLSIISRPVAGSPSLTARNDE